MTTHWTDTIKKDACKEALDWAKTTNSLQEAWNTCKKGNWMLWLLNWNKLRLQKIMRDAYAAADDAADAAAIDAAYAAATDADDATDADAAAADAADDAADAAAADAIRKRQPNAPNIT